MSSYTQIMVLVGNFFTLAFLVSEFIRLQENEGETRYVATQLGLACLSSSLSPDEGMHVAEELQRARKAFVLENELHIVYQVRSLIMILEMIWCKIVALFKQLQVVPIYAAVSWPNMDWIEYLNIWERLSPDMKRVGEMVGVEERFLIRAMRGTINKQGYTSKISKSKDKLFVYVT